MWSLPAPRGARTTLALAPIPVTQAGWTGQDALPLSLYQALVAAVFRSQESQPQFPMVSPTSNFEFQTPPLWPAIVESYETSVIPTKLASFGQIESRITATHFLRALRRFELPRGAGLRPATPTFLSARLGQPPSHAPRNWLRSVKPTLPPVPKKNHQLQKIGFVWSNRCQWRTPGGCQKVRSHLFELMAGLSHSQMGGNVMMIGGLPCTRISERTPACRGLSISCSGAAGLQAPSSEPVLFEEAFHGLAHAFVMEDHGGPGGTRNHRIEQRDHAVLAVENREFHGQRFGDAHFHAGRDVLGQTLAVFVVERARLEQQTAGYAARAGLFHQLFVEGIDSVGRARKLHILAFHFGQHAAVLRGGLGGLGNDAQKIERAPSPASLGVERLEIFDEGAAGAAAIGQVLFQDLTLAPQVSGNCETG